MSHYKIGNRNNRFINNVAEGPILMTDFSPESGLWFPINRPTSSQVMTFNNGRIDFAFPGPSTTDQLQCMGVASRFKIRPPSSINRIQFRARLINYNRLAATSGICNFGVGWYKMDDETTTVHLTGLSNLSSGNNVIRFGGQSLNMGNYTGGAQIDLGVYAPIPQCDIWFKFQWNTGFTPDQLAANANCEYSINGGAVNTLAVTAPALGMGGLLNGVFIFLGAFGTASEYRSCSIEQFEIIEGQVALY